MCLFIEIGKLKNLEIFYAYKNELQQIPIELSDCKNLIEINFDDNLDIREIPSKIFNLPKLQIVQVDRKCI